MGCAAALAIKTVAAKRGLKLEKHGSLWDFVNTLVKTGADKDIVTYFGVHSRWIKLVFRAWEALVRPHYRW